MNSFRELSSRARRRCMSLKLRASWPSSSEESTGIGWSKWPSATASAASRIRRSRRETAPDAQKRDQRGGDQCDQPGDQDLAAHQSDVVVHLGELGREHLHPAGLVAEPDRDRGGPDARSRRRARRRSAMWSVARSRRRRSDTGPGSRSPPPASRRRRRPAPGRPGRPAPRAASPGSRWTARWSGPARRSAAARRRTREPGPGAGTARSRASRAGAASRPSGSTRAAARRRGRRRRSPPP